jgi:methyl-accepting chemotaxis protein
MDIETLALELQKTADRAERNTGRIKKLEEEHEAIHQIATSVAVMAEKMDSMNKSLTSMSAKVEDIENRPAKRWESVVSAIIGAAAGAFLAWVMSGMPGAN